MASRSIWDEPVAQQELLCYIVLPELTEQAEVMNPHKSRSGQHRYLGCSDVLGVPCWNTWDEVLVIRRLAQKLI
jgi:hypothetical protein